MSSSTSNAWPKRLARSTRERKRRRRRTGARPFSRTSLHSSPILTSAVHRPSSRRNIQIACGERICLSESGLLFFYSKHRLWTSLQMSFLLICLFELEYPKEVATSVCEPAAGDKKSERGRGMAAVKSWRSSSGVSPVYLHKHQAQLEGTNGARIGIPQWNSKGRNVRSKGLPTPTDFPKPMVATPLTPATELASVVPPLPTLQPSPLSMPAFPQISSSAQSAQLRRISSRKSRDSLAQKYFRYIFRTECKLSDCKLSSIHKITGVACTLFGKLRSLSHKRCAYRQVELFDLSFEYVDFAYVCFELDSKKKSRISIWSWAWPGRGRGRVFSDKNYRNGSSWGCGRRSINQDSTPACVPFCSGLRRTKESFAMFCMSAKDLAP
jgi:hypothetical protein